jgi:hypothetical protein
MVWGRNAPICVMSDDDINKFVEYWGDSLPNPEHEPIRFMWYVKLWKYYRRYK